MPTQLEKATAFQTLHHGAGAFIIPNPWDVGSARILAHFGFEALATTSMGFAFSIGKLDTTVDRDTVMDHISAIVGATDLPVSADLENGYGDSPEIAAETIKRAAAAGAVGGSIEDATGRADDPIHDLKHAAERVHAAAEAARALPFPFMLVGRAENYLHGRSNLADTIARLQAYQEAGAHVLYAPGLTTKEDIAAVVSSVDRPVNVVMGLQGAQLSVDELAALGVKRVSVGGSLCRASFGALVRAAREMKELGTFTFAKDAANRHEMTAIFRT